MRFLRTVYLGLSINTPSTRRDERPRRFYQMIGLEVIVKRRVDLVLLSKT
jgi:hypothetical protein